MSTLAKLSFVKAKDDGSIESMWNPATTGDSTKDGALGRQYGQEICQYMRANASYGVLYQVTKAMARHKMGAVEIGFFTYIGAAATATGE